jgi:hypothetical protein
VKGSLRSDDRVLLLGIPSHRELASIARVLIRGALVALGTREEVDRARAEMAEFDNAMFIEAQPDRIPWRDQFFTKVLVAQHLAPLLAPFADELQRILAPGGEIVRLTEHV